MKKLQLKKEVVSRLNDNDKDYVKGGTKVKTFDPLNCIIISHTFEEGCEEPKVTLDTRCNQVSCITCESCLICG